MAMLMTAGVIFLSTGAKVGTPICATTGSGTLAWATGATMSTEPAAANPAASAIAGTKRTIWKIPSLPESETISVLCFHFSIRTAVHKGTRSLGAEKDR